MAMPRRASCGFMTTRPLPEESVELGMFVNAVTVFLPSVEDGTSISSAGEYLGRWCRDSCKACAMKSVEDMVSRG